MAEGELMLEARKVSLEMIGQTGSECEATLMVFAKRQQAVALRDAADASNNMGQYEARNWCLFQAQERER